MQLLRYHWRQLLPHGTAKSLCIANCKLTTGRGPPIIKYTDSPEPTDAVVAGWREAKSNLDEFGNKTHGSSGLLLDPWSYIERLSIFKCVLKASDHHHDKWGFNSCIGENLLWGLVLQLGWQYRSGRLRDPRLDHEPTVKGDEENEISGFNWWACMNYYFCALPFFAAVEVNLFDEPRHIEFKRPQQYVNGQGGKFFSSVAECKSTCSSPLASWIEFFTALQRGPSSTTLTGERTRDDLVTLMWKAHTQTIMEGLKNFSHEISYLSPPERNFGEGWANMVEFIAATKLKTTYPNCYEQASTFFPERMLRAGDRLLFIADMTVEQNRFLQNINQFLNMNTFLYGLVLSLWKRGMRTEEGRTAGHELLRKAIVDPDGVVKARKDVLRFSFF